MKRLYSLNSSHSKRSFRCFSWLAPSERKKRNRNSNWLTTWLFAVSLSGKRTRMCARVCSLRVVLIAVWCAHSRTGSHLLCRIIYYEEKAKKKMCQLSATNTMVAIRGMYHMARPAFIRCVCLFATCLLSADNSAARSTNHSQRLDMRRLWNCYMNSLFASNDARRAHQFEYLNFELNSFMIVSSRLVSSRASTHRRMHRWNCFIMRREIIRLTQ